MTLPAALAWRLARANAPRLPDPAWRQTDEPDEYPDASEIESALTTCRDCGERTEDWIEEYDDPAGTWWRVPLCAACAEATSVGGTEEEMDDQTFPVNPREGDRHTVYTRGSSGEYVTEYEYHQGEWIEVYSAVPWQMRAGVS